MPHTPQLTGAKLDTRLRATAEAFMPQNAQLVVTYTRAKNTKPSQLADHDYYRYRSASHEDVSATTVCDDTSNTLIDKHNPVRNSHSEAHDSEAENRCALCTTLGRVLGCCEQHPSADCPRCSEISQIFAKENEKHKGEMSALQEKVKRLEGESPEERYARLCAEKNAKIDMLKDKVSKVKREDEQMKIGIKEQEKTLKRLEAEIKKSQPAAEFTFKEAKKGKKK